MLQFLFVIIVQTLGQQLCEIYDYQILLGDYYTQDGQTLARIEYKTMIPCEIKFMLINNIPLRIRQDKKINNLYFAFINDNFPIQFDHEYGMEIGNQTFNFILPSKNGTSDISLILQNHQVKLQYQDIQYGIFDDILNSNFLVITIQSINLIITQDCYKNQIKEQIQQNNWNVLVSYGECSVSGIDALIQILKQGYVTFKSIKNPFQQLNSFQIHEESIIHLKQLNDSTLEIKEQIIDDIIQEKQFIKLASTNDDCSPYGQRISLGYYYTNYASNGQNDVINIAYNTLSYCPNGFVHIFNDNGVDEWVRIKESRILNMSKIYENTSYTFTYVTYINVVSLNSLIIKQFGIIYNYEIYGDAQNSVGVYKFKVPLKEYDNQQHKIIFFGDMDSNWTGNNSNFTFNWFQANQNSQDTYDFLIFEGDMAYDLESLDCQQGDWWLRNMTTFTSYFPLISTPGNHDSGDNYEYDYYRLSFLSPEKVPNTRANFYNFYSFDSGLVHFIFYNPDNIVYGESNQTEIDYMVKVFEEDLIQAQENRENVPWIIVNSHYPMYCSDDTDSQCGQNNVALQPFADLFTQYGVAIYMSAHQHNYERDAPFINNQSQVNTGLITDGPEQHVIMNSAAPVYVIEGAAGQEYYTPDEAYAYQPYTIAQTSGDDGIGIMTIINRTHIYYEHLDVETMEVVDYFWVIQERGNGNNNSINIILGCIFGATFLIIIIVGVYYLIRRQRIKEQLLP